MRNKRVMLLLIVLMLVLLLGIGYALTTKTINVTGNATATASKDNFNVKFEEVEQSTLPANVTAEITSDTEAKIEVTSGLTKAGDTVSATYVVKNISNGIDASITAVPTATNSEYFEVTTNADTATTVKSGETTKVTVTIKVKKTPVDANQTSTIKVALNATAVAQ